MASPAEKKLKCDVSEIQEAKNSIVDGKIVKLSPVKTAKSGSRYFDGEMSDGRARKRFVSFDTRLRSSMDKFFQREEAVSMLNCEVKKSQRSGDDLEIIASTSTQVIKCEKEFDVERIDDSLELAELAELKSISINQKVTVTGKVTKLEDAVSVKRGDGSSILKRDCVFADCSSCVRLVVWEGDVNRLVVGDSYRLRNVCVRQWQGVPYISLSGDATIHTIDNIGDVEENVVVSKSQSKEVKSDILAVHSVVIYFACCLCGGKVMQEGGLGTCNKCDAVMKMSRCKRTFFAEFSIADIGKVKAFSQVLESVIELETGDDDKDVSKKLLFLPECIFIVDNNIVKGIKCV